jgi:hypothetical protein
MAISCECCVLSGRGLCVGLIARPEESDCAVPECDREASKMRRPRSTRGCWTMKKIIPVKFNVPFLCGTSHDRFQIHEICRIKICKVALSYTS